MKIYNGTKEQVLAEMSLEHKKARRDMLTRKMAARLRKEELDEYEEIRPRVKFCASKVGNGRIEGAN